MLHNTAKIGYNVPFFKGGRTESRDTSWLDGYAEVRNALGEARGGRFLDIKKCRRPKVTTGRPTAPDTLKQWLLKAFIRISDALQSYDFSA